MAPRADFSDATKLIGATEAEVSILIGIHHVVQFGQWHSSTLGSGDGRRQKKKNLDNSVDDQRGCSDSIASSAPTWTSSVKQRQKLNFFYWERQASDFHLLRPQFKVPEVSRTRSKKRKAFDAVIAHSNVLGRGPSFYSTKTAEFDRLVLFFSTG